MDTYEQGNHLSAYTLNWMVSNPHTDIASFMPRLYSSVANYQLFSVAH